MSSENVQKRQVKMYNFGGIIFRDIHQGYTSSFAALDMPTILRYSKLTAESLNPAFSPQNLLRLYYRFGAKFGVYTK